MGVSPQCYIPSFVEIGPLVPEKVFKAYMGLVAIFSHVTKMPRTNFCSPKPRRLHIKFGFDWQRGFRWRSLKHNAHKHVNSPRAGADNHLGSKLFHKHKSSVNLIICCRLFPLHDFLTVFTIQKHMRPKKALGCGGLVVNTSDSGSRGRGSSPTRVAVMCP